MTIFQIKNSIETMITVAVALYLWYKLDFAWALISVAIVFIPFMILEWPDLKNDAFRPVRWLSRAIMYIVSLIVAMVAESTSKGFYNTAKSGGEASARNYKACVDNIADQVDCEKGYAATQEAARSVMDGVDVFNAPFGLDVSAVTFVLMSSVAAYVLATLIFFVICKYKS